MLFIENYDPLWMQQKSVGLQTNVPLIFGGQITHNASVIFGNGANIQGVSVPIIDATAATLGLTASQANSIILLDRAAGVTVTLPPPAIGLNFSFAVKTAVTSNNHKVITDAGTTLILGGVTMTEAADTNAGLGALFNGTTHVSILMNGTTTGGIIGTFFNLTCVTATQWVIEGIVAGSGTLATCASTS
jgi:hypothetical protein